MFPIEMLQVDPQAKAVVGYLGSVGLVLWLHYQSCQRSAGRASQ